MIKKIIILKPVEKLFNFHELSEDLSNSFENKEKNDTINRNKKSKTNFFNSKMLECIHNYKDYINNYLKNSFNNYLDNNEISSNFYENLFEFEITNDNQINILGNIEKNYYVRDANEIFIEFVIDLPATDQNTFGIKMLRRGNVFGGKYSKNGLIEGDGIFINKKGDLYIGEFEENHLYKAIIYGHKGQTYEGTVKNFKKHGVMQTEITPSYEFIGDFEDGKKVQGIYYPKYDEEEDYQNNNNIHNINNNNYYSNDTLMNSKVKIKSIEINNENLDILKKAINQKKSEKENISSPLEGQNNIGKRALNFTKENFITKITLEYEGKTLVYTGSINDNRLNDINAILHFDVKEKFPLFNGSIINNAKDGKCRFYNSESEFFSGSFVNGKFVSDMELAENNSNTNKKPLVKKETMKSTRHISDNAILKKIRTLK